MLIGQVPFDDPSTPALLVKHLTETPPRPSIRRPELSVPASLEAVAMRCLEKDPARRYQTAAEFSNALQSAAASVSDSAHQAAMAAATVLMSSTGATPPPVAASGTAPTVMAASAAPTVPMPPPAPPSAAETLAPTVIAPTPAAAAGPTVIAPAPGAGPTLRPPAPQAPAPPPASAPRMAAAPHADAGDRLPGGDVALPPPSSLQNLTSVGAAPRQGDTAARRSRSAGSSVVLVVLTLVLVGGVGFVAYSLGYFSGPRGPAETDAPASLASVPPAPGAGTTTAPAPTSGESGSQPSSAGASSTPAESPSRTAAAASTPPAATAGGTAAREPERAAPTAPPAAAPSSVPAQAQAPPPTPVQPAASAEPPRPAHPSVRFGCDGPDNVCLAIQAALDQELDKASMTSVNDESRAEIVVDALVVPGTPRSEQMFGTVVVIRPFTVTFSATARRTSARVPMPTPTSFTMDDRVGQTRLTEQSRLMATAVVQRIQTYWAR
jgi:hypothetical protein